MQRYLSYSIAILSLFVTLSCGSDDTSDITTEPSSVDNFDRTAMLQHWADNIIVPGYQAYQQEVNALHQAAVNFTAQPNETGLENLREQWLGAYLAWQKVSMFEIGKAEALTLRSFTNIYPTDTTGIKANISSESYNLELASKYDEQGFPAIEYLIYSGQTEDIVQNFQQDQARALYLTDLTERLQSLITEVAVDWEGNYREIFISNSGSSSTSATNKLINDIVYYYERSLRAGKIGIPAGVFSGSPLAHTVEGIYAGNISKQLFMSALQATRDFFNGIGTGSNPNGESLRSYLEYLNTVRNGEDLGAIIDDQFETAYITAMELSDNFAAQVVDDNTIMLRTYDELQKNVVYLKVDMMQALDVRVDYVDADGD